MLDPAVVTNPTLVISPVRFPATEAANGCHAADPFESVQVRTLLTIALVGRVSVEMVADDKSESPATSNSGGAAVTSTWALDVDGLLTMLLLQAEVSHVRGPSVFSSAATALAMVEADPSDSSDKSV